MTNNLHCVPVVSPICYLARHTAGHEWFTSFRSVAVAVSGARLGLRWRLLGWQLGSLLLLVAALGTGTVLLSERFLLGQVLQVRQQQASAVFDASDTGLAAQVSALSEDDLDLWLQNRRTVVGAEVLAVWKTDGILNFDANLPEVAQTVMTEDGQPRFKEGSGVLEEGGVRYYWQAEPLVWGQRKAGVGLALFGLPSRTALLVAVTQHLGGWLALAAALSLLSTLLFARWLGRTLLNLEPAELAALTLGQERLLQTVREGVIELDAQGNINLANGSAARTLSLQTLPQPAATIWPELQALDLSRDLRQFPLALRGQAMRLNVTPLPEGGSLVAFGEWQEATRLAEELTHTRSLVDAMRARAHEYGNRLHVVAGFLQLGRPTQALEVLQEELDTEYDLGRALAEIGEPRIAALLAGKMARARELRLRLVLSEESSLPSDLPPIQAEALMTALGNFIENAFEVLQGVSGGEVRVEVGTDPEGTVLEVRDNGAGVPAGLDPFAVGQTTKGSGRGLGLSGVANLCRAAGGEVWTARQGEWTVFGVNLPSYTDSD